MALLATLGAGSTSTLDSRALAARLAVLRDGRRDDGRWCSDVLPVTEIDTGGAVTSYGLDAGAGRRHDAQPGSPARCSRTRAARACGSWWRTASGPRAWWRRPATKLVDAGFRFVNGGNASPFNDDPSGVLVPDGTEQSMRARAAGRRRRWGCRTRSVRARGPGPDAWPT